MDYCRIIYHISVTFGKVPNISLHTAHLVHLYHHFCHKSKTPPLTNSMQLFPTVRSRSPPFLDKHHVSTFFRISFPCPCLSQQNPCGILVDFLLWAEFASSWRFGTHRVEAAAVPHLHLQSFQLQRFVGNVTTNRCHRCCILRRNLW